MDVAIIILNSIYKDKKYENLAGVPADGDMIQDMLSGYSIHREENIEDIKMALQTIKNKVMGKKELDDKRKRKRSEEPEEANAKGKRKDTGEVKGDKDVADKEKGKVGEVDDEAKDPQINRLHFHFSGHGGSHHNEQCLVGTTGTLILRSELINLLLEFGSETITTTYDCCRGWATPVRYTRSGGSAPNKGPFSMMTNRENIFEIHATVDDHKSFDDNSLTKELSKVTNKGKKPILISEISREVNNSWQGRGIENQASESITIERGINWRDYMWPRGTAKERVPEPTMTDLLNAINKNTERVEKLEGIVLNQSRTIQTVPN